MPKAPTSLQSSDITSTSVHLSWLAPDPDESSGAVESYVVQYRRRHSAFPEYDEVPRRVIETDFTLTGLDPYTTYEIRVVAVNNIGRGLPSSSIDVKTGETG